MKYPFHAPCPATLGHLANPVVVRSEMGRETVATRPRRMHLTKFSDYALRVLMLAAAREDSRLTIEQTAATFGISQAHLKKVMLALSRAGYLRGIKGRTGGYLLARKPEEINLGAVLRITEPDFSTFECFNGGSSCLIAGPCRLRSVGHRAVAAFLATFDTVTLADMALPATAFRPQTLTRP